MTRKEEIKQAAFNNDRESSKENQQYFLEGAEWSDENPDEKMIAKYLYEKKGYPIDLNGNLHLFDDTMKAAEQYLKYKQDELIEKACEFLKSYRQDTCDGTGYIAGIVNDKTIDAFKEYMKGE